MSLLQRGKAAIVPTRHDGAPFAIAFAFACDEFAGRPRLVPASSDRSSPVYCCTKDEMPTSALTDLPRYIRPDDPDPVVVAAIS